MKKSVRRLITLAVCLCILAAAVLSGLYLFGNPLPELPSGQAVPVALGKELPAGAETTVQSDGGLDLIVGGEMGRFSVYSHALDKTFSSNPADFREDPYATGIGRTSLASQLVVECVDQNGKSSTLYSASDAVMEDGYRLYAAEKGVYMEYTFPKYEIRVVLHLYLSGGTLVASIPAGEGLSEGEGYKICRISLLPFMGAAGLEETGYMLVPDGPGGIIPYNSGKQTGQGGGYAAPVYGRDPMLSQPEMPAVGENALLPCFAHRYAQGGILAIITGHEADAAIHANVSKAVSGYNNVYASFAVRGLDTVKALDRTWASKEYAVFSKDRVTDGSLEVTYAFLPEDEADLLSMAGRCRERLFPELSAPDASGYPLFLDVYMGVEKKRQTAGLIYTGYQPLTTFGQLEEIVGELSAQGVEGYRIRLNGATGDGAYFGRINTRLNIEGSIGGFKGYQGLLDRLEETGSSAYLAANLAEYSKSGNGFSITRSSAVSVTNKRIERYEYRRSSLEKRMDIPQRVLLHPSQLREVSEKLAVFSGEKGIGGLADSQLCRLPYSSFNNGRMISRQATAGEMAAALETLSQSAPLMLEAPNAYAVSQGDALIGMPVQGSSSMIVSRSVPFLYMILHGYVPYSGAAVNQSDNAEELFLNTVECGASLNFSLLEGSYEDIRDTTLDRLYSCSYEDWKGDMAAYYQKASAVLGPVSGLPMTGYECLSDTLRRVEYGGRYAVYVNYDREPVVLETGETVGARDAVLLEREAGR